MTEGQSRTAVDVLLAVEQKQDVILHKQNSIDLINKVNSNKLTQIEAKLTEILNLINEMPTDPNEGFTMDPDMNPHSIATAPPRPIKVADEFRPPIPLTVETQPVGERRTARGQDPKPVKKNTPTPSLPIPKMKPPKEIEQSLPTQDAQGKLQVEQRIVDKNSKAIFKADIEIVDANGITVSKTQTGLMGKWNANLTPGKYRVHITKMDNLTNGKMRVSQDLTIDGKTPRELPMMIIKS